MKSTGLLLVGGVVVLVCILIGSLEDSVVIAEAIATLAPDITDFAPITVDGNEVTAMYSAKGSYLYDKTTSMINIDITDSTIPPDSGPGVGILRLPVVSMTETDIICSSDVGQILLRRISNESDGLVGTWYFEMDKTKNTLQFTFDGFFKMVRYDVGYSSHYFIVPYKPIIIDGYFDDWSLNERIYVDTDGPDCNDMPGRDIREVYIAQDEHTLYIRFVMNGLLDSTFGYKFGDNLHLHIQMRDGRGIISYSTPVNCSAQLPDYYVAVKDHQFECQVSKHDMEWEGRHFGAWCDQGKITACRDYVNLPALVLSLN